MERVYLGLGSNLGEREEQIRLAVAGVGECVGRVVGMSGLYETEAWGYASGNRYVNAAVGVETCLGAFDVLAAVAGIERAMGRVRGVRGYCDRVIDIDVLLYGECVLDTPRLVIPHRLLHERLFVLAPLAEIAGEVVHPVLGKRIVELYAAAQGSGVIMALPKQSWCCGS